MSKFKKRYTQVLYSIIGISAFLFILSCVQIIVNNIGGEEPLVYGFGFLLYSAFNWADVFIFTLLWMILSLVLLKIKNPLYFFVAYFSFWLIRSSGEILYSLLQQFHPSVKPWLGYFPRSIVFSAVGEFIYQKYWVVEQIVFQSIAIFSLFSLIFVVIKLLRENKILTES